MKTKSADQLYCNVNEDIIKNRIPVFNPNSLKLFYEYIVERYKIHLRKDINNESAPYTDNEVLRDYKFCNVRRDHDRSSKWLIDNISNDTHITLRERIYKSIIYRLYNKVDTAELIDLKSPFFFDNDKDGTWLDRSIKYIQRGMKNNSDYKFYTNAYKTGGLKNGIYSTLKYYYYNREVLLKNYNNELTSLLEKESYYLKLKSDLMNEENTDKENVTLYYDSMLSIINEHKVELEGKINNLEIFNTDALPNKVADVQITPELSESTNYKSRATHVVLNNGERILVEYYIKYEGYSNKYEDYKLNVDRNYLPLLLVNLLMSSAFDKKLLDSATQLDVYNLLRSIKGCGNFIAYQLYVDLTYIDEFPFSENEFVVAGPGCYYGTELLMKDRYNFSGMTCEEVIFWLRDNLVNELKKIGIEFNPYELFSDVPEYDRCLNVMMIENCLCEFQKYWTLNNRPHAHVRKYKEYQKEI